MLSYARGLLVRDKSFSSLSLGFFNFHEDCFSFWAQVLLFSNLYGPTFLSQFSKPQQYRYLDLIFLCWGGCHVHCRCLAAVISRFNLYLWQLQMSLDTDKPPRDGGGAKITLGCSRDLLYLTLPILFQRCLLDLTTMALPIHSPNLKKCLRIVKEWTNCRIFPHWGYNYKVLLVA